MTFFLRPYRIAALVAWSALLAVLSIPYQVKGGWSGIRGLNRLAHLWNKGVAKILNLRVTISGEMPRVPGGVVVSNHVSYLDIVTHGSILPVRYSPKADIAKWPVLGWYIGLSRPIWTDRESKQASIKTSKEFAQTVQKGMYLIVYPEGTSTDGKSGILPFKSTSFEAAIDADAPVIPVLIRYTAGRNEPEIPWYGDMTFLPHAWKLLGSPSLEARVRFLRPIVPAGRSRKELASFVHDVMAREYENLP